MSNYIDRAKVNRCIDSACGIKNPYSSEAEKKSYCKGNIDAIVKIQTAVDKIPNVSVEGKPKGKWIKINGDGEVLRYCSNCHAIIEDITLRTTPYYFCFHCGADMEINKEEES